MRNRRYEQPMPTQQLLISMFSPKPNHVPSYLNITLNNVKRDIFGNSPLVLEKKEASGEE
ncbi:hypothetical protein Fmac_008705 [Flemingia macrophylla]|uniref:Uncharacterized protein n=1 Tax=Flemingia macrophylla TaxID=520843 RepID=A0ABD1MY63_9FABA